MRSDLLRFRYCPIAARFIDNRDDAESYYAHRLVGDHQLEVDGRVVHVHFNSEETHLFTDTRQPCPEPEVVLRAGGREQRCFSVHRARMLDAILPTIAKPTRAMRASIPKGVMLFGPPGDGAVRFCVVVAPSRDSAVWFVRTAFQVAPRDFLARLRSTRPAPWPPK